MSKRIPKTASPKKARPNTPDRSISPKAKAAKSRKAAVAKTPAPKISKEQVTRHDSKQSQLLALLRRDQGVSLAEASEALAWQPHSVRGVLSGVIKKKLKLAVEKFDAEGVTRYRVAG